MPSSQHLEWQKTHCPGRAKVLIDWEKITLLGVLLFQFMNSLLGLFPILFVCWKMFSTSEVSYNILQIITHLQYYPIISTTTFILPPSLPLSPPPPSSLLKSLSHVKYSIRRYFSSEVLKNTSHIKHFTRKQNKTFFFTLVFFSFSHMNFFYCFDWIL